MKPTFEVARESPKRFAVLARLDDETLHELDRVSEKLSFRRAESFLLTGDPARSILFLRYGRLMRRSAEFILELVESGMLFGETAADRRAPVTEGEALETSCVWVIPRAEFDRVVSTQPKLASKIERTIGLPAAETPQLLYA